MAKFLQTSLAFTAGLLCVLIGTDRFLGRRMASGWGRASVAPEVYLSVAHAGQFSTRVRALYLGDSVAHQMFPPFGEPDRDERYLANNQAISLAGQYFLLADALKHCPNARDAYLIYYPGSFENDLGPPLANDYFCGFFHKPAQIRDVFEATHDVRLSAVQIGRLLLPHILEANSNNRPMEIWSPVGGGGGIAGEGLGPEPVLMLINRFTGGARGPTPPPLPTDAQGRRPVMLSDVSRYFLPKMRDLCRARGVRLHVLPCPCSDAIPFIDHLGVYDRPFLYEPHQEFVDWIHFFRRYVDPVRRRMIAAYGLPDDSQQGTSHN
ncbi:MAG TPA: hypothetical protein VGI81_21575 [Tepidisphaeraceae bacterium]|jgi:hypothetical protein